MANHDGAAHVMMTTGGVARRAACATMLLVAGCAAAGSNAGDGAMATAVCADTTPVVGGRPGQRYRSPFPTYLAPPPANAQPLSNLVKVRVLVSTVGTVDSVVSTGVDDPSYRLQLHDAIRRYRFQPAVLNGCRTRAWTEIEMRRTMQQRVPVGDVRIS